MLSKMINIISHRGPDDHGLWFNKKQQIGLAHARLSIIDISSAGRQPMSNEDDALWLTYNGEIYNYRELRLELIQKGHAFKSNADSEVLLHLYEEEGHEMLARLNGIFSFAIWDAKQRELFIAKDAIGVKPLYYSETTSGFLFASELKALLVHSEISSKLDVEAIQQYMAYLWTPAPKTMLHQVKKMKPAYAMIVKHGKIIREWHWYELPYTGIQASQSDNETFNELAKKIQQAVKRQLVSDVPVGAFLSGGLDSSAVVSMMRANMPDMEINCYGIGFENTADMDGDPLDLPFARKVAQHLDVNLHEIVVTPDVLINKIDELIYCLDEPQADPAPINAMIIAERARADGIKVLLSGAGGDDIFSGYRRHAALMYEKYWQWLPLAGKEFLIKALNCMNGHHALVRRLKKAFAYACKSSEERLVSYFKWLADDLRWNLLSEDLKNELYNVSVEQPLIESLSEISRASDPLQRMLYLETKHFLADHNLNYTDKTSMKYGVEVRVPLLDLDVVSFSAQIPPSKKQKGKNGKLIFKQAMEPYLPKNVIYRKKTGFGAPLRKWINSDLKEMKRDLLSGSTLKERGLFDAENVQSLIMKTERGEVDGAYTIFSIMCIELWCRLFIDSRKTNMSVA